MAHFSHRRDYLRQILLDAGTFVSTGDLHRKVSNWLEDPEHLSKTTLRDLQALEESEYVVSQTSDDDKRAYFWHATGRSFDLTLSPPDAMTLTAIFNHAERFGLRSHTEKLNRLRSYAALVMKDRAKRNLELEKRITTGTRFTVLRPGKYDPAHLNRLQLAILDDEPLEVTYLPRNAGGVECIYQLKPLALSHQDSNIYLSAYVLEEEWPSGCEPEPDSKRGKYSSNGPNTMCALMLHRIAKIEPGKRAIPDPKGYDVNSHEAQEHLMTIHSSKTEEIKLRLSANLHNRLSENPLADDQVLVSDGDGWMLTCNLHDTQGLRLFLLSNAADIEVLSPQALRIHVRDTLSTAMKFYADDQVG